MEQRENEFLTALYHENVNRLFGYVVHACNAKGVSSNYLAQVAEDIVQDTLHTAAEKMDVAMSHPNPGAWLMTICKHKFQEYMRRVNTDRKYLLFLEAMSETVPSPSTGLETPQAELEYANALAQIHQLLSPEDYRLFELLVLHHSGHATAAKTLGISVWSSQQRLHRIRDKLRPLLSG